MGACRRAETDRPIIIQLATPSFAHNCCGEDQLNHVKVIFFQSWLQVVGSLLSLPFLAPLTTDTPHVCVPLLLSPVPHCSLSVLPTLIVLSHPLQPAQRHLLRLAKAEKSNTKRWHGRVSCPCLTQQGGAGCFSLPVGSHAFQNGRQAKLS